MTKPFQCEEVLTRVKTHLTLRNLQKHLEEKNAQQLVVVFVNDWAQCPVVGRMPTATSSPFYREILLYFSYFKWALLTNFFLMFLHIIAPLI